MDAEETARTAVMVELFGKVAYAVCCCCRQEVHDHHDANYRRRWRRWVRKAHRENAK